MHIPELSTTTYASEAHRGVHAVSVGWLGEKVTSYGTVPPVVMKVLRYWREHCYRDDYFLGYHTCEICGNAHFHGEFWIETAGTRYVLPVGIFHYIDEHGYCPPERFLREIEELALASHDKPVA
jgi:hypothetical protein